MSNGTIGFHEETAHTQVNGHSNGVANGNSNGNSNGNGTKLAVRKKMDRKKSSPMMPSFMVSAPGKVIVYGEHAVVHGKAAIAAAISLRSYLLVTSLSKSKRTVTLRFPDIDFNHSWNIDELPWSTFSHPSKKKYYYSLVTEIDPELVAAVQPFLANISLDKPADIRKVHQNSAGSFLYMFLSLGSQSFPGCQYTLRSTIPIGAGLGSSASIAVCMSTALLLQLRTLSGPHPDQPPDEARLQVERVNRWAFVYEMFIHGNPSGVDNTVSAQGKAVMFQRPDYGKPPAVRPLWDFPELPLLLVDTKQAKSTAAEVAKVGELKKTHPKLIGSILDAIDKVTQSALDLVHEETFDPEEEESLRRAGELMTINHGLLVSLGVSHPRLERVRELVDHQGIGWTKLTGAGGGGCSITLLRPGVPREKLDRLEHQLEEEGYQKFETTLGGDGVGVLWPAVLKNGMDEDEEGGMEIDLENFLNAEDNDGVERVVPKPTSKGSESKSAFLSITFICKESICVSFCGASTTTAHSTSATSSSAAEPKTANERSQHLYNESHPFEVLHPKSGSGGGLGIAGLSREEQIGWLYSRFALSLSSPAATRRLPLGQKAQKELWRHVNESANLPIRAVKKKWRTPSTAKPLPGAQGNNSGFSWGWGIDRNGHDVGELPLEKFQERCEKRIKERRHREDTQRVDTEKETDSHPSNPNDILTETDEQEEMQRRREMASLRRELYGEITGTLTQSPEWDDVVPMPHDEPEAALATIAYPDDYDEAMSYLRAVMVKKEYSPRCLRLTEHIISMNPAHYTVWLYRASNIFALKLSIPDEIQWLNDIALENLKNYQIWHHRHLLVENYFPEISGDRQKVAQFAGSEISFLGQILAEDTKNYHVWSYRSYLVRKLSLWDNQEELRAIEGMIQDDVRNNSAWSHRFFLVFSNPEHSTAGSAATEFDPKVPDEIVEREVRYATAQTYAAPQNQSPWNYLKGVLVKGGRKLGSVEEFTKEFVEGLGEEGEGKEDVKSTHALDLLAEIYAEKGDTAKADLCLRRLAERYDRIRVGYWEWRRKCLSSGE
ncbi:hypothetical protein QBC46DRAFT_360711 [Diplogelasinospora grovesii]|uniref:mevalonate kinase n=1 Tax=Diplogelasinospora grovesii TaxID=303347 RepID=A0AAN6NG64_9PEZI|nr:hypothetical protein QBC46DRAFT_360711 [Diplogelasinospora grovesii]